MTTCYRYSSTFVTMATCYRCSSILLFPQLHLAGEMSLFRYLSYMLQVLYHCSVTTATCHSVVAVLCCTVDVTVTTHCVYGFTDRSPASHRPSCVQVSLQEGCRKILVADGFNLLRRMITTQRRAIYVDGELTYRSLFLTHRSLFLTHRSLSMTHRSLSMTHRSLSITYRSLSITYRSLSMTHR